MFNGHKGDADLEGELPEGDNGNGDCENGEGNRITGKGQRSVLKGEPLGEGEPEVSHLRFRHCIHNKHNFFH